MEGGGQGGIISYCLIGNHTGGSPTSGWVEIWHHVPTSLTIRNSKLRNSSNCFFLNFSPFPHLFKLKTVLTILLASYFCQEKHKLHDDWQSTAKKLQVRSYNYRPFSVILCATHLLISLKGFYRLGCTFIWNPFFECNCVEKWQIKLQGWVKSRKTEYSSTKYGPKSVSFLETYNGTNQKKGTVQTVTALPHAGSSASWGIFSILRTINS